MRKLGLATLLCFGLFLVAASAYGDTVVYTGESDTTQFPPTMDGGAAITYEADKIVFAATYYTGEAVTIPHAANMGRGDFVYTAELAMEDFDGVSGYMGHGIHVNFGPEVDGVNNEISIKWQNWGDVPGKYIAVSEFGTETTASWDGINDAGQGGVSLRLALTGSNLVASYKPVGGEWTEHATYDIGATAFAGMDWSLAVSNFDYAGATDFGVDEITVTPNSSLGVDTDTPVIYISGDDPWTCEEGVQCNVMTPYTDPGAMAIDPQDGDITDLMVTEGVEAAAEAVRLQTLGTYPITYTVTDSDGNTAEEVRNVIVAPDSVLPTILLLGDEEMDIAYDPDNEAKYTEPGYIALDNVEDSAAITLRVEVGGAVDVTTLGTYTLTYNVSDNRDNAAEEVTRVVTVKDLTGPVVTFNGEAFYRIDEGGTYEEFFATADDDLDGDVTAGIVVGLVEKDDNGDDVFVEGAEVDGMVPDTYRVGYRVSDAAGNETVAIRTIFIVDTKPPVITLNDDRDDEVSQWSDFDYADIAAAAEDITDGDITAQISIVDTNDEDFDWSSVGMSKPDGYDPDFWDSVDTSVPGVYSLLYVSVDTAGNAAYVTRTLTVGDDTELPVITLLWPDDASEASETVTLDKGGVYLDAGASARDDVDGLITDDIVVDDSALDMSTPGTYAVTISVSDGAGNTAAVERTVIVVPDETPPDIDVEPYDILSGETDPVVAVGGVYRDAGAAAADDADGDLQYSVVVTSWLSHDADGTEVPEADRVIFDGSDAVDTRVVGTYSVAYNVTDVAGNAAEQEIRTVTIVPAQVRGTVTDADGNVLEGALIELYVPVGTEYSLLDPEEKGVYLVGSTDDFFEWRYETQTTALVTVGEGDDAYSYNYQILLPLDAPVSGYHAVVSADGKASDIAKGVDPDVDTVIEFSLKPKAVIGPVTADPGATNTDLNIIADPAFTSVDEVNVSEFGEGYLDRNSYSLSGDGSIDVTYEGTDDFAVLIKAGPAEEVFRYVAEDVDLLVAHAAVGPDNTLVDITTEAGQPVRVEVPADGVAQLTKSTVEICQIPIEAVTQENEGSPDYVYEIAVLSHLTLEETDASGTATVLAATGDPLPNTLINRVEITIPVDLGMVSPGDLEEGIFAIYRAESRSALYEPGSPTPIPVDRIIETDYIGDGAVGSVTFWTDELSVFSIGSRRTEVIVRDNADGPPACFINTIGGRTGSLFPVALIAGLMLAAVFLGRIRGRSGKAIAGLAALLACAFVMVGPADAEDAGLYVEFNGMYTFESIDDKQTEDRFSGPLAVNLDFDDSLGFQFALGRTLTSNLAVEAMFEYVSSESALTNLDFLAYDKLEVLHGSVNAKLSLSSWKRARPYVVAGLGAMSVKERMLYHRGEASKTRDFGFSIRGGAGVDVFVTDTVSIGLEAAYSTGIGDVDHVTYATVSVGIGYHF